jgi:hypothetical protein
MAHLRQPPMPSDTKPKRRGPQPPPPLSTNIDPLSGPLKHGEAGGSCARRRRRSGSWRCGRIRVCRQLHLGPQHQDLLGPQPRQGQAPQRAADGGPARSRPSAWQHEKGCVAKRGRSGVTPIGPQHRKAGVHHPEIGRSLLYSAPGQADLAAPDLNRACGDCACFRTSKMRGKGRCSLYQRRMGARPERRSQTRRRPRRAFEPRSPWPNPTRRRSRRHLRRAPQLVPARPQK